MPMLTAETPIDQLDAHGKRQRIMEVLYHSAEPLAVFEVATHLLGLTTTPIGAPELTALLPWVQEVLEGLVADGTVLTSDRRSMGGPKVCYYLLRTDLN